MAQPKVSTNDGNSKGDVPVFSYRSVDGEHLTAEQVGNGVDIATELAIGIFNLCKLQLQDTGLAVDESGCLRLILAGSEAIVGTLNGIALFPEKEGAA